MFYRYIIYNYWLQPTFVLHNFINQWKGSTTGPLDIDHSCYNNTDMVHAWHWYECIRWSNDAGLGVLFELIVINKLMFRKWLLTKGGKSSTQHHQATPSKIKSIWVQNKNSYIQASLCERNKKVQERQFRGWGGMERSKDSPHMVLTAKSRGQQLVVQSGAWWGHKECWFHRRKGFTEVTRLS